MQDASNKTKYNKTYAPTSGGRKNGAPFCKKGDASHRDRRKRVSGQVLVEPNRGEAQENGAVPGRNAVRELLKSGRAIEKVFVKAGEREGSITVLIAETLKRGIPLIETERAKLDALCGYEQHQGIVAIASEKEYVELDQLLEIAQQRSEAPLLVIADGITDPHNLGALIRCAEGAGAHGIVLPKRRAAGVTPAVTKASAGAVEYLAASKCTNVTETIRKLKERGLWIFGAEAGGVDYTEADFSGPCAVVFGSEEQGISELVRKNCDFMVSIPMRGRVNSLNVSTAASVILYEAVRQRAGGKRADGTAQTNKEA